MAKKKGIGLGAILAGLAVLLMLKPGKADPSAPRLANIQLKYFKG